VPWRGRLTTVYWPRAKRDQRVKRQRLAAEVAGFVRQRCEPVDSLWKTGTFTYSGPAGVDAEHGSSLHYAALCKAAGGVDASASAPRCVA